MCSTFSSHCYNVFSLAIRPTNARIICIHSTWFIGWLWRCFKSHSLTNDAHVRNAPGRAHKLVRLSDALINERWYKRDAMCAHIFALKRDMHKSHPSKQKTTYANAFATRAPSSYIQIICKINTYPDGYKRSLRVDERHCNLENFIMCMSLFPVYKTIKERPSSQWKIFRAAAISVCYKLIQFITYKIHQIKTSDRIVIWSRSSSIQKYVARNYLYFDKSNQIKTAPLADYTFVYVMLYFQWMCNNAFLS